MNRTFLILMLLLGSFTVFAQSDDDDDDGGESNGVSIECVNKWGPDSIETQKNLSMFNQYFQEKKYVEAFPYWYYLYLNAPCVQKRVTYNGPYIIKKALREEQYKPRFEGLVDTLIMVHYKRIEFFGDEGKVLGYIADDMAKLKPPMRDSALKIFSKAISITGEKTRYDVPKDYVYAALKQYKRDKLSVDSLLIILDEVSPIVDANIARYTASGVSKKDSITGTKWLATQEAIIAMLKPYLDCDKIVELREPAFADNMENTVWLNSTLKLMGKGGCEGEEFYLKASEALYKLEPSAQAALALGQGYRKLDQYEKASNYLLKAVDKLETNKEKFDVYMLLAKNSADAGNHPNTRKYARMALELIPNSGEAYIMIGDAYLKSASSCSGGDLGSGGVYLAAYDKYAKAKNVDPSVSDLASKRMSNCSARFPDRETAFFKGINDGDSYTVGCWIGETTIVRTIGG